jgi:putative endonuclease
MTRWHVYLIRCRDGALYTGIATDVSRRLAEHQRGGGRGAKYLRGKGPLRIVLKKAIGRRGLALKIESRIKRLPKWRKEGLIGQADRIEAIVAKAGKEATRRPARPPRPSGR